MIRNRKRNAMLKWLKNSEKKKNLISDTDNEKNKKNVSKNQGVEY
jgi:hypothetical protein